MQEDIKTIKGIKRKEKMMKEGLDNLITSIQVDIYDDGKAYISEDNSSGSEYNIILRSPKTIVDAFDEYIHDNFGYFSESLKEDLEREFTIFYNRDDFKYGLYGAIRVKATDEDAARKKFFDKKVKEDPHLYIYDIRPTENEDIRKGIRLMEEYENKVRPVNDEAQEAVNPAYAQALRDEKDFNEKREKKINVDLDNVLNKNFTLDEMEKYTLDESLFEDKNQLKEELREDYLDQFDITPDRIVKELYTEVNPEEFQLDYIHPTKTIKDMWEEMKSGEDFYKLASIDGEGFDSDVREVIFQFISIAYNIPYGEVFDTWLHRGSIK